MGPKENGARPAFQPSGDNAFALGLTKREHFAAMAMQGLVAAPGTHTVNARVALAVECADALLRALAAGGEG